MILLTEMLGLIQQHFSEGNLLFMINLLGKIKAAMVGLQTQLILARSEMYDIPIERPDLGIEVNEVEAAKILFNQDFLVRYWYDDGSVAW